MEYKALYREYRPSTFDEIVGQKHIVEAIRNSIKNSRIAHAYLLCGTRGTGKTSIAKIMARAVNCLDIKDGNPCNKCSICKGILTERLLDVIEIDAASNNSVDNIRDIREEVAYHPSEARYKVYIIDEVHMLSTGAFNALLKTLEEPPAHVIFILATTEPQKLPATILSRCQRYDFKRISQVDIYGKLEQICSDLEIKAEDKALKLIASVADGALRDALSILDKCISVVDGELTFSKVFELTGISNVSIINKIIEDIVTGDIDDIVVQIDKVEKSGIDMKYFLTELIGYMRDLLICLLAKNPSNLIIADDEALTQMKHLSKRIGREQIIQMIEKICEIQGEIKVFPKPKVFIEVSLIALAKKNESEDSEPYIRLEKTEEMRKKPTQTVDQKKDLHEKVIKMLHNSGKMLLVTYLAGTTINVFDNQCKILFKNEDINMLKTVKKEENIAQIKEVILQLLNKDDIILCCESQGKNEEKGDGFSESGIKSFFGDIPISIVE